MKTKMQNTNTTFEKKPSGLKAFLGAIAALGIFASLMLLSNPDLYSQITKYLKADVISNDIAAPKPTPTIISFTPTIGKTGDQLYIAVQDWEGFTENETAVFFGETPSTVSAFGESGENQTMIIVEVPTLSELGEYSLKITTPNGMLESDTKFTLTELEPTELNDFIDFSETPAQIDTPAIISTENYLDSEPRTKNQEPIANFSVKSEPNGIQLSWDKPEDQAIANYNIYYGSQSGNYIHSITSQNTATFIDNLENNKMYFFQVSAVDASGNESTTSNEVSTIFSQIQTPTITEPVFHASSPKPPSLSEEGPAETLLISFGITFFIVSLIARKKFFGRDL
jgi:hypothetical protein